MDETSLPPRAQGRVPRDARQPFGSQLQKLAYPARKDYHRHWFNDDPGRIDAAIAAGYTHVLDKEGKRVCRVVGVNPAGGALHGYLMEIPEDWYQEDMARQHAENDKLADAIRRGAVAGSPGEDGRYIPPTTGIKVTSGKRPF